MSKNRLFNRNKADTPEPEEYETDVYLVSWLAKGDNRERVINYFQDVVGIEVARVSIDGVRYDAKTRELHFRVFLLDDYGRKVTDHNSGESLKQRMTVPVDFPPPWL